MEYLTKRDSQVEKFVGESIYWIVGVKDIDIETTKVEWYSKL